MQSFNIFNLQSSKQLLSLQFHKQFSICPSFFKIFTDPLHFLLCQIFFDAIHSKLKLFSCVFWWTGWRPFLFIANAFSLQFNRLEQFRNLLVLKFWNGQFDGFKRQISIYFVICKWIVSFQRRGQAQGRVFWQMSWTETH